MLDAHPQMAVPPETHFLPDVIKAVDRGAQPARSSTCSTAAAAGATSGSPTTRSAAASTGRPLGRDHARRGRSTWPTPNKHGKTRWGDKTPKYSLVMIDIEDALPEARFIHLIRDARAVALSRVNMVAGRGKKPPNPAGVAGRWAKRIHQARAQGEALGGYLEVRYEDLVRHTEADAAARLRLRRARVRPGDARLPRQRIRAAVRARPRAARRRGQAQGRRRRRAPAQGARDGQGAARRGPDHVVAGRS